MKTFGGMITFNNLSSVNVGQAAMSVEQVVRTLMHVFYSFLTKLNMFLGP